MLNDSKRVKILLMVAVIVLALLAGAGRRALSTNRGDLGTQVIFRSLHYG